MNIEDRITIALLNHYAFVIHENITDLTNEEIDTAREFAMTLNGKYVEYSDAFKSFANQQRFKATTNKDYNVLMEDIFCQLNATHSLLNIYDWKYRVFYDLDYENYLLLAKEDEYGCVNKIDLQYNIQTGVLSKSNIKDNIYIMEKLGELHHNSYDIENIGI